MKLKVYEHSANYTATVISLPVKQKVEGLDNLVKVTVFGNDCLVSKDENPDELYLFFPAESQLSNEFCSKNNLYRDQLLNIDQTKKGFFELHGRVKTLKFKGVTSTGFVIPATSLMSLLPNWLESPSYCNLKIGDEFNEIDGIEICRKYVPKNLNLPGQPGSGLSKQDKVNNKLKDYLVPNQFRLHNETSHLSKNLFLLHPNDIIVLTDKWHGSSCILSKVLINKKLNWYQKLLNKIGGQVSDKEYGYIISSGKPKSGIPKMVLTKDEVETFKSKNGDFYTTNIWKRAFDDYKHALEDGVSIYSELCGMTSSYKTKLIPIKLNFIQKIFYNIHRYFNTNKYKLSISG